MTLAILLFIAGGLQAFSLFSALGSGYVKGVTAVMSVLLSGFIVTVAILGGIALTP